jgi:hypothetical protein
MSVDYVPDTTRLFRRITREWVVNDKVTGKRRLSSNAFKNWPDTDRMSIALEDTLACLGRTPESIAEGKDRYLVALEAGYVRSEPFKQDVRRSPKDGEPEHGDVVGAKPKSLRNAFAEAAEWIVPADGPPDA